jgi:hypothetical protein
MKLETVNRFKDYDKEHCWQYDIRMSKLDEDLAKAGMTREDASNLKVDDFFFRYVDKSEVEECRKVKEFIEGNEWLSCLPNRPTHRFAAYHTATGIMAGAVVMATPNSFSHILGADNKDLEKLIARGACISWSPKGLGSWIIMKSIKWMAHNTTFRVFTAYSDPEAKELGTIYQACNFLYLGQQSGNQKQYYDPNNPKAGWFGDRTFRHKSKYAVYARNIGISKEQWKQWWGDYSPRWDLIPEDIRILLKQEEKNYIASCLSRDIPAKHKYAYIEGPSYKETKQLRELFKKLNPKIANLPYPKKRGK